ncbi:MAG: hypothetical protein V3V33_16465 [Candidatus Lokiarchaeia archaeon]
MSKYYTPEIEEFHVGFEYEVAINDSEEGIKWIVLICNEGQVIPEINLDKGKYVRVKYLDREDIESLGWKYQPDRDNIELFYDNKTRKHSIIHNTINNWVIVTLRNEERKEDYTVFVGTIKNKSELKRLLKQLGI